MIKDKKPSAVKWAVLIALPLTLMVVLSRVAQQHRTEAATEELFRLWDKGVGEPAPTHQVEQLLHQGADVKKRDIQGRDALHYAAFHGPHLIQIVLNQGADVNTWDNDGFTPLMCAIFVYDSKSVRLLLSKGASPNLRWHLVLRNGSHREETALSLAYRMEKSSMRRSNRRVEVPALREIIQRLKAAGAREL